MKNINERDQSKGYIPLRLIIRDIMSDKSFFDEETVEKVREYEKTERAVNEEKKKFEQIHKQEIMAESAKSTIKNEDLLQAYIGKNYNKIVGKRNNWSAFFFGGLYLLYRKMYLYALIVQLFQSAVISYITSSIMHANIADNRMMIILLGVTCLMVLLMISLSFNGLYINKSINNINHIKEKYPKEKLIDVCKEKGGTNLAMAIIVPVVITAILEFVVTKYNLFVR